MDNRGDVTTSGRATHQNRPDGSIHASIHSERVLPAPSRTPYPYVIERASAARRPPPDAYSPLPTASAYDAMRGWHRTFPPSSASP